MKTAKLGVMFLVSLMALAGIGIGYAAWTDTIYVQGTVNTGSVGWHFTAYSGTWAYKDLDNDACVITHWNISAAQMEAWNKILVAHAEAYQGADYHHAIVTFDNIFPLVTPAEGFCADLTITYTGTVPGRINSISVTNNLGAIDAFTTLTVTVKDASGQPVTVPEGYLGLQLHNGYTIHIEMCINPPETQASQGLSGSFDLTAQIIQWNEYPHAFIP